jgi:hypothetical protein
MQKLLVFQSLWGMERLRSEARELTLAEKVARIAAAGFDGVTDHFHHRPRWARPDRPLGRGISAAR